MTRQQPRESPQPEQVIDLTGGGSRYVEIQTDAGTFRVHTGLVSTDHGSPVVLAEVEANDAYHRRTAPGGEWMISGRYAYSDVSRYEVRLVKVDD